MLSPVICLIVELFTVWFTTLFLGQTEGVLFKKSYRSIQSFKEQDALNNIKNTRKIKEPTTPIRIGLGVFCTLEN